MSETQKPLAAHHEKLLAACVGYRTKLDELESENAALRERLRDSEHSQSVWMQHAKQSDQKLAAAQQAHLCDLDRRANIAALLRKAKDKNAALRADKERLDWVCKFLYITRTAIDAARKEGNS